MSSSSASESTSTSTTTPTAAKSSTADSKSKSESKAKSVSVFDIDDVPLRRRKLTPPRSKKQIENVGIKRQHVKVPKIAKDGSNDPELPALAKPAIPANLDYNQNKSRLKSKIKARGLTRQGKRRLMQKTESGDLDMSCVDDLLGSLSPGQKSAMDNLPKDKRDFLKGMTSMISDMKQGKAPPSKMQEELQKKIGDLGL